MTQAPAHDVCAYPWQQMNIDLTGEVVPCCFWSGYGNSGKPLGNTNEQTLDEIWNGEGYRDLRRVNAEGVPEGHPCHQCMAWQWSGGRYPGFSWPVSFRPESGRCFTAPVPERFRAAIDGREEPVLLLEDDVPLPHPEALHDDIREQGGGRYSVWGDTLYFSASDDSDPRTNGRTYELLCGSLRRRLTSLDLDSVSGRNLQRAHGEYEQGAEVLEARPSMLSFISTADCNIDCPACSQNTVRLLKVQHRERTELDVLALVPYLHQFIWHGGEPYLIKRFRAFIDGFRTEHNPNLTFGFTSNGTLLDADELDKLARFPRFNGSVSVDSFQRGTFEVIRAGANFDTVLANVLRAVERYDDPDFVLSVGMIITKRNVTELPDNLAFALEHDIGLNLSPVVVYPVTERLDVFRDFHVEAHGWREALARARQVLEQARARGAAALRRIDPAGMLDVLQSILDAAARRYAEVFPLTVEVSDPTGSLPAMRHPGLIVSREGEQERPLAYLPIDRGPGTYQMMLPRAELAGSQQVGWALMHDLLEPMGVIDMDRFRAHSMESVRDAGWSEMPSVLALDVPAFEPVPRPRNARLANGGLPTPDGRAMLRPDQLHQAYQRLVSREREEGRGAVLAGKALLQDIEVRARDRKWDRYQAFQPL